MFLHAVQFTLLPSQISIGFVGVGAAVGAFLEGLYAWMIGVERDDLGEYATEGAIIGGFFAISIWFLGNLGVPF